MAPQNTVNFDLKIRGQVGAYTVEAIGPNGIRVGPQPLIWPATSIWRHAAEIANINRLPSTTVQALGHELYAAAFLPAIASAFAQARESTLRSQKLRLRLNIEPIELVHLPWEAMHDGDNFLSAQTECPLVRVVSTPPMFKRLRVRGPLRILFVSASPRGLPPLDVHREAVMLREVLKDALARRRIILDVIHQTTLAELRGKLLQNYHILYFAGHGDRDRIYLDDGHGDKDSDGQRIAGDPYLVSARDMARELEGKPIRLIFLGACRTTAAADEDHQRQIGIAEELAKVAKLPAIVAMQYPIGDKQAIQLTKRFFEALSSFQPIDVALAEARKSLIRQGQVSWDMVAPLLYLQANDGELFERARDWAASGLAVAAPSLILCGCLAILLGTVATYFFRQVRERQAIAFSQELAAQAQGEIREHLDLAALLSLEAYQTAPTVEARSSLLAVLEAQPYLKTFLHGHTRDVHSFAFSPDGKILASGTCAYSGNPGSCWPGADKGEIRLWDLNKNKLIKVLYDEQSTWIDALSFSPDGRYLVSAGANGRLLLWRVNPIRSPIEIPIDISSGLDEATFSHSGRLIAWASFGTVGWIDTETFKDVKSFSTGAQSTVYSLTFSPDDSILALTDYYGIQLWDMTSSKPLGDRLKDYAGPIVFGSSETLFAAVQESTKIVLLDITTLKPLGTMQAANVDYVVPLGFVADEQVITAVGYDRQAQVARLFSWDVSSGELIGSPLALPAVVEVELSPDGTTAVAARQDGPILVLDLTNLDPLRHSLNGHTNEVASIAYSPTDDTVISSGCRRMDGLSCVEGELLVWDVNTYRLTNLLSAQPNWIEHLAYSPDGMTFASASCNKMDEQGVCQLGEIQLWDARNLKPKGPPLISNRSWVHDLDFSPDGKLLAAAGDDGVVLWDVAAREPIGPSLDAHQGSILTVSYSPNGKWLAAGGGTTLALWDTTTWTAREPLLQGHTDAVLSVAFSPDSQLLASGGRDYTVVLWDVTHREMLTGPLFGQSGWVTKVAFSPDGHLLVSNGGSNLILWDPVTHRQIGPKLPSPSGASFNFNSPEDIVFSSDSQSMVTGGPNKSIVVWKLDYATWQARACQIANRNLTQDEWHRFLGDVPYHETCPTIETP